MNECHVTIPYSLSIVPIPLKPQSVYAHHLPHSLAMASEHERPRITEVQVRMDCNGCVQKIKKALHHIPGITDLYIDFPQQKVTIIGCAEPAKIVKAIKKTRKGALICYNTEPAESPAQPQEPPSEGEPPADASENQSPTEAQQAEAEPPKNPASPAPVPVNSPPQESHQSAEEKSSSPTPDTTSSQPVESSKPKDVEEVHVIHHYPPDYNYRYNYGQNRSYGHGYVGSTSTQRLGPAFMAEPPLHSSTTHNYNPPQPEPHIPPSQNYNIQRPEPTIPLYATHNYNTHRPSPYVTQYEYTRPPPQYTNYSRPVPYSEDYNYYYGNNNSSGNIISVFSDENPNACTIV